MRVVRYSPMILGSCSSPAAAPLRRRASPLSTSRWRFFLDLEFDRRVRAMTEMYRDLDCISHEAEARRRRGI